MTTELLKEEARKHEQNEEWIKALEFYLKAIEKQAEDAGEPDIALHNRVGDLQIRLGDIEGAVASYETAIQFYLDAELHNNAIAICRKIIRNAPTRPGSFLRMGQIRARQGFLADARQNYLTYAEMMEGRGKTEEAFRALEEFVGLVPRDVETRLFLADNLIARGSKDEAVRYLIEAHRASIDAGSPEKAEEIAARVREIDPALSIPAGREEAPPAREEDSGGLVGFETTAFGEFAATTEVKEPEPAATAFDEAFGFSDISLGEEEGTESAPSRPADESPTPGGGFQLPDLDRDSSDDLAIDGEAETPLPIIDFGAPDDEGAGEDVEAEEFGSGDIEFLAGTDLEPLPGLDEDVEANPDEEIPADLPLLADFSPDDAISEEAPALADPSLELEPVEEEPAFESFDLATPADALTLADPLAELRAGLAERPGDLEGWQRLLEYAYQVDDQELVVEAFLGMGAALNLAGEAARARATYRQLLAIDPGNSQALAALGEGEAPARSAPPAPAGASSDEYVDLGSLVLDDRGQETTRWVVSAAAPSGDENADFSRLLSQFKEQVARNLSVDDAQSHYDLGTAYKEMGLVDEAIAEYQLSLRADPRRLATFEMLGQCFLERGEPIAAVRILERGLQLDSSVEDDLLGIYYYLARAQEANGNGPAAKDYYERIFALDINFKDVTERLRELR